MKKKSLENEELLKVSGGLGKPRYSKCPACGKSFQGVQAIFSSKYPLNKLCPICAAKNKK